MLMMIVECHLLSTNENAREVNLNKLKQTKSESFDKSIMFTFYISKSASPSPWQQIKFAFFVF